MYTTPPSNLGKEVPKTSMRKPSVTWDGRTAPVIVDYDRETQPKRKAGKVSETWSLEPVGIERPHRGQGYVSPPIQQGTRLEMGKPGMTGGDLRLGPRRGHRVKVVNVAAKHIKPRKPTNSEKYKAIYEKIISSAIKPPDSLKMGSRHGQHPIGLWNDTDQTGLRDEILLEPSSDIEMSDEEKKKGSHSRRMRRNWTPSGGIRRKLGRPRGIRKNRRINLRVLLKNFRNYVCENNKRMRDLIRQSFENLKNNKN